MRIIAGTAGRIAIKVPPAVSRPTTDFVRQAVFSILGEAIAGARVLDLFAGSGAVGLEALSRGAATCTFVDSHRPAAKVIAENLAKTRLAGGQAVTADAAAFLKRDLGSYDFVFADPPYWQFYGEKDHAGELLADPALPPRIAAGGWCIVEVSTRWKAPETPLELVTRREYGSTAVWLFQKNE